MRSGRALALVALSTLLAQTALASEIYRYTDEDGNEVFTNQFDALPKHWQEYYEKQGKKPTPEEVEKERARVKALQQEEALEERLHAIDRRLEHSRSRSTDKATVTRHWQTRKWAAELRLERLKKEKKAAEHRANELTWLSAGSKRNGVLTMKDANERNEALKRAKRLSKAIKALEHELNTVIPEEARKAGVDPGALRKPRPKPKRSR